MIVKVIPTNSALTTLNYIDKDGAVQLGSNMGGQTPGALSHEMRLVRDLNPRITRAQAVHVIVSLSPGEHIDSDQMCEVLAEVRQALGYNDCQWVARSHSDTAIEHAHMVINVVDLAGRRIDRGGDRFKAKQAARALEAKLGLQAVTNQRLIAAIEAPARAVAELPLPALAVHDIEHLRPGMEVVIRQEIANVGTLGELAMALRSRGVDMRATVAAKTGRVTGLGFAILGQEGSYLKASDVHSSFSLSKLQSKHSLTYDESRDLPSLQGRVLPPVQQVLPLLDPPRILTPARITRAQEQMGRYLLVAYRRTYGHAKTECSAPALSRHRWRRSIRYRTPTPAIAPGLSAIQPGIGYIQRPFTPEIDAPRFLQPGRSGVSVVQPDRATGFPERERVAARLGTGVQEPTQPLEGTGQGIQGAAGKQIPAPWDAAMADLGISGGAAPGRGRETERPSARQGEVAPGVSAARIGHPGAGQADVLVPAQPGSPRPGGTNAAMGAHGQRQSTPPQPGGIGGPGLGGGAGEGGPGGRDIRSSGRECPERQLNSRLERAAAAPYPTPRQNGPQLNIQSYLTSEVRSITNHIERMMARSAEARDMQIVTRKRVLALKVQAYALADLVDSGLRMNRALEEAVASRTPKSVSITVLAREARLPSTTIDDLRATLTERPALRDHAEIRQMAWTEAAARDLSPDTWRAIRPAIQQLQPVRMPDKPIHVRLAAQLAPARQVLATLTQAARVRPAMPPPVAMQPEAAPGRPQLKLPSVIITPKASQTLALEKIIAASVKKYEHQLHQHEIAKRPPLIRLQAEHPNPKRSLHKRRSDYRRPSA